MSRRCCAGRTGSCSAARRSLARSTGCFPAAAWSGGETLDRGAASASWRRSSRSHEELHFEGPIAVADSIAPHWTPGEKHVVHIIFGVDLSHRSLEDVETRDAAVRGLRLFSLDELEEIVVHPPIKRFLQRWQPGDPAVYLGSLWVR